MLLASKQNSGAQTKYTSKLLEKLQCTVTANKGVPPEREELQPELPQCQFLATNMWALMVLGSDCDNQQPIVEDFRK